MSSETKIAHVFNYGEITEEHKDAAKEIAGIVESFGNPMLSELIKQKFKVTEIPRYDLKDSKFAQACIQANVFPSVQGYVQEGTDLNKTEYPLIGISEDVRKLEKLFEIIKNS